MDEAVSALTGIKVEGGPGAISYKNYNLPSRASRQRLLKVAQNISMLCVPEGGMHYDWDLYHRWNDDSGTCYTYPDFVR